MSSSSSPARRSSRRSVTTAAATSSSAVASPVPPPAVSPRKTTSASATPTKRKPKVEPKEEEKEDTPQKAAPATAAAKSKGKGKGKADAAAPTETTAAAKAEPQEDAGPSAAPPRKRAKKEAAEPPTPSSIVPVRPRQTDPPRTHWVGAHVSSAGGPQNAVLNALRIGADAFALFVRPKMQWAAKDIPDEHAAQFRAFLREAGYERRVVPHGCYLINLGNPDQEKKDKAMGAFLDDLRKCHKLGIELYNFHPGSTVGQCTKEEGCKQIAECINTAHAAVPDVVILLENMAGLGNIVGGKFEELRTIMDHVKDRTRVGVCIDTAHAFAAGYDMRTDETYEATLQALDATVGLSNVRAMHFNDSKADFASGKDRHENIGAGKLGIAAFWRIMNDARLARIPCVLETPGGEDEETMREVWAREVELLYMLQGLDKDGDWSEVHKAIEEVQRIKKAAEAKSGKSKPAKKPAAASKAKGKGKKAKKDEEDSDLSDDDDE